MKVVIRPTKANIICSESPECFHLLTDVSLLFTKGPLWLGPPSHQVSLGRGRVSEEGRPRARGGPSANACSERLQHPQDSDRWHACVHGADRRPVSCPGRPQEERPGLWEAREGVHSGLEVTGRGQFRTQGALTRFSGSPQTCLILFWLQLTKCKCHKCC